MVTITVKKGDMRRICLEIVGFHARRNMLFLPSSSSSSSLGGRRLGVCVYADKVDLESTGGPECNAPPAREEFNSIWDNHLPDIEIRILIYFRVTSHKAKKNHTAQLKNISRRKQEIFFLPRYFPGSGGNDFRKHENSQKFSHRVLPLPLLCVGHPFLSPSPLFLIPLMLDLTV